MSSNFKFALVVRQVPGVCCFILFEVSSTFSKGGVSHCPILHFSSSNRKNGES